MNHWQILRQWQYRALAAVWPDRTGAKLFSEVKISAGRRPENLARAGSPVLMLNVGTSTADPSDPDIRYSVIEGNLFVIMPSDEFGEAVLMGGGGDDSDEAYSGGMGLMRVEGAMLETLAQAGDALGIRTHLALAGDIGAGTDEESGMYGAGRTYRWSVPSSAAMFYHRPGNLIRAGGVVSWTLPPDRYDRYKIILTRKAGTTPPTTPDDGDRVTLSGNLATSVADATVTPVSWSVFCAYDENYDVEPTKEDAYSSVGTQYPGTTWTES